MFSFKIAALSLPALQQKVCYCESPSLSNFYVNVCLKYLKSDIAKFGRYCPKNNTTKVPAE